MLRVVIPGNSFLFKNEGLARLKETKPFEHIRKTLKSYLSRRYYDPDERR
jgi:hypothetical protein